MFVTFTRTPKKKKKNEGVISAFMDLITGNASTTAILTSTTEIKMLSVPFN